MVMQDCLDVNLAVTNFNIKEYWQSLLHGFVAPNQLFISNKLPNTTNLKLLAKADKQQKNGLSSTLTSAVESLAQAHKLSLNTIIQGAWALLLSRYSGEDDVVFGVVNTHQPSDLNANNSVTEFFSNIVPVRLKMQTKWSVLSLLQEIKQQSEALDYYDRIPLTSIEEWSEIPQGIPLFETVVAVEDGEINQLHSLSQECIESKYPLKVIVSKDVLLQLEIRYNSDRFDEEAIARMLGHLQTLLSGMVENPEQYIAQLPLLTATERHQLLVEWNNTQVNYPRNCCIQQLFEFQVERSPHAIAVEFGHQQLTYLELNHKANQLAHHLKTLGVKPEVLVGICVERSLEMVIAVLATLKAGGAYVPIDPEYPQERLAFMLEDTSVSVLLTQTHLCEHLPVHQAKTVCLDDWEIINQYSQENPQTDITPDNLAYVIYTSGSTGKPKGVLIEHGGLTHLARDFQKRLEIKPDSRVLQLVSFSFDPAVADIATTLISGATLVLTKKEDVLPGADLIALLREAEITNVIMPAAILKLLPVEELPCLRTIAVGGEACTADLVAAWAPGRRFQNHYGPTEVTICTTVAEYCDRTDSVTIGCPIANTQVYILDRHLQPVPIGVPGELYIGGDRLARGYLKRPDLTAERFIPNPFNREQGTGNREQGVEGVGEWRSRGEKRDKEDNSYSYQSTVNSQQSTKLYKTGDLVRYLPDGNIEFLGRIDNQVKIRGFRIELGEIETALLTHPEVQATAVIAREDKPGDKRLVAYIVSNQKSKIQNPKLEELRQFLQQQLPYYMVPSAFVLLDSLPLTTNGKVDLRSLPIPEVYRSDNLILPRTPIEEKLARIWREVLGLKQVGVEDNFFELGGHSLLATQVISRVRAQLNVNLPQHFIFEAPTIAELGVVIAQAQEDKQDYINKINPIKRNRKEQRQRSEYFPLSFAQERLWFISQLQPDSPAYNVSAGIPLSGLLDVTALESSLNELVRRHEALRTTFALKDEQPVQVIAPNLTISIPVIDLQALPEDMRSQEVQRITQQETLSPFNLTQDILLRLTLLRLSATEYVLLIVMHHIISDGWSMSIFLQELAAIYEAKVSGKKVLALADLPIQYADYAVWQRQWLQTIGANGHSVLQTQLDYWKQQLNGAPKLLELPMSRPRPPVQSFRGATVTFKLPENLSKAITLLSQQEGVTIYMTLLAAFKTLLYRYTQQEDLVIGSPIASRNHREIEGLIGFFINTLVLRTDISGNPSFQELLKRIRKVTLGAYAHQDIPFHQLVQELQPEREPSYNPLFQIAFALQQIPTSTQLTPTSPIGQALVHTAQSLLGGSSGTAKFDLALFMNQTEQGLIGEFEYNTDLFDTDVINRMIGHFQTVLTGIVTNPEQSLSELPILTVEEQQQLQAWNLSQTNYPIHTCIHQLFASQAEKTPSATAVVFANQQLTYAQLNAQANQLAHYLQKLGVGKEVLVGICVERSLEMVIGLLGILKAGAAYIPLDPSYPPERLAYMLEDSQVPVLLTQEKFIAELPQHHSRVVCLDADWEAIAKEPQNNPVSEVTPDNLAYVIYTSGSTGKPKGVQICHHSLTNFLNSMHHAPGLTATDIFLAVTTISFDIAALELYLPLIVGAKVVIVPREVAVDGAQLKEILVKESVTTMQATPATWRLLLAAGWEGNPQLKILCGGEALPRELALQLLQRCGTLWNMYGPTETTIWSTIYNVGKHRQARSQDAPELLGRPIANTQIYILDSHLQPVPVGVPGEVYIGGFGLARGYLNRPDLTAERFIPNPFNREQGEKREKREKRDKVDKGDKVDKEENSYSYQSTINSQQSTITNHQSPKIYKTGDLARYLPDGNIEYIGRIDNQVKIRGFRIELGEIEALLTQHPQVKEAVVTTLGNDSQTKRLVAYIVGQQNQSIAIDLLRDFLAEKLPNYMMPSAFVLLDKLPLTPNGKVDRRALPAPVQSTQESNLNSVRTTDLLELQLIQIWEEILEARPITIKDNFFNLGGHSLLAVRLVSQIEKTFQKNISLSTLFQAPTIEQLAKVIRTQGYTAPASSLLPMQVNGSKPPFFFINSASYAKIITSYLGKNQPFYCLNIFGLTSLFEKQFTSLTIQDLALQYIKDILAVQPQGPYFLGTYCADSILAFEIAQQLQAQGKQVALLAFIDAMWNPNDLGFYSYWYNFRQFGYKYIFVKIREKISFFKDRFFIFFKNIKIKFASQTGKPIPKNIQDIKLFAAYNRALDKYVPQSYQGKISLFLASECKIAYSSSLEDIATEGVELHEIDGFHHTMFTEPQIKVLAGELQNCIDSCLQNTK